MSRDTRILWSLVPLAVLTATMCTLGPDPSAPSDAGIGEKSDADLTGPPARQPTPCIDGRDPGLFPIRQIVDATSVPRQEAQKPSTGLVIFDRSGSMDGVWEIIEDTDPPEYHSKWDSAGAALLGAVTPSQERVTLGALFFPQGDGACDVAPITAPTQVGFRTGAAFLQAWDETAPLNPPAGSTPLQSACAQAEQALEQACVDGLLDQRSYVMILTDGYPNCGVDLTEVEAMLGHWRDHGIGTYVFGLPGSEDATDVLNRLSTAGGTETLFVPGNPGELESGLEACM